MCQPRQGGHMVGSIPLDYMAHIERGYTPIESTVTICRSEFADGR